MLVGQQYELYVVATGELPPGSQQQVAIRLADSRGGR